MATPPTIDIDSLIEPISADAPCGRSLKEDPTAAPLYYRVKDAREAARAAERSQARSQEGEGAAADKPDWRIVVELATELLQKETKDLWIAAWLIEGLVRLHWFAGLRDGFRLVRELAERYFDCLHPRPDEEGVATTMAQLAGLNGEGGEGALLAPIAAIAITQGVSSGPFTGHDYSDAEGVARTADPEARARRVAQGSPTLEMLEVAARETPPEFFSLLREDIAAASDEFARMTAVLEEKCGTDVHGYSAAPPSSKIASALAESLSRVQSLMGEPASPPLADDEPSTSSPSQPTTPQRIDGSPSNREDAFKLLLKVADYFRRAEPHSPVSYALEQAVRWGRMPLPELIRELVNDDSVRRDLYRRTGIKMENED